MTSRTPWLHDWRFREGHVTRAFDEWRLEHGYLIAYTRVGIRFLKEGYDRLWSELGSQPSDGEGPDLIDLFDREVDGLTDWQFKQIHLAAALRDAVTVYDMYLEAALAEVLAVQLGRIIELPVRSPSWADLKDAWKVLAMIDLDSGGVRGIRGRRNWLTHQRGQFRTDRQREEHDTNEFGWPDPALRLTEASVADDFATLADGAARLDLEAFRLSWTRESAPDGGAARAFDALMRASLPSRRLQGTHH